MSKILYLISIVSSFCWLLLFIYQIVPVLDASDYITLHHRKEFVIETLKLLAYATGIITFAVLGCYKSCFNYIQQNFLLKFCTISFLLTFVLAYDGFKRENYYYMAYAVINFVETIYVHKEIVREWEEEMRNEEFIDDNVNHVKANDKNYIKIDI